MKYKNMAGQKFSRLLALCYAGCKRYTGKAYWVCACDCGRLKFVQGTSLRSGVIQSCGCLQKERAAKACSETGKLRLHKIKHGHSPESGKSPEYTCWDGMVQRTTNPNFKHWKYYGGRGIMLCDRWRESFSNFLHDMGSKPAGHEIHRLNHNGGYEPGNCVWIGESEHSRLHCKLRWEAAK